MGPRKKLSTELSNAGKLKVTKIEAAVFQLETAISLWFSNADAMSVATLSFAAHELLYQLNKAQPKRTKTILDAPDEYVMPDVMKKEWNYIFKMDYYFCKHGGTNPEETHFLAHKNLKFVIADAIRMYRGLGFHNRLYFELFQTWLWLAKPEVFHIKATDKGMDKRTVDLVVAGGKEQFFEHGKVSLASKGAPRWTPVLRA
jgi:hypothetical protein